MRAIVNIVILSGKELRSLARDWLLLLLVIYSFGPGIYIESTGEAETINNAAVAFVDEDKTALSRALRAALYPPFFKTPAVIEATHIDAVMDGGDFTFVVVVPRGFEADVVAGRNPELQLNIDATAVQQAAIGTGYIQNIIAAEVNRFASGSDGPRVDTVSLVARRSFNPTGNRAWFAAIGGLLNHLSMVTIILTGAALIREREHGTLEHLLVMPLKAYEIAVAKVVANGLVVFVAFALSVFFVVEGLLDIPVAGSTPLLLLGAAIYLFAAAAIGILLGIVAKTMGQFALLMMLTIMPMMILSGGMSPVESQPVWLQWITWLLPSRHFHSFASSIVYRGAGFDIIWPEFLATLGLGAVFFATSLVLFRRSVTGA